MSSYQEIPAEALAMNPIRAIGTDWMLVGAKNGAGANPMTASWGGTGYLWRKPVAYVVLRPSRFTRELVDRENAFSLNFLGEQYREQYTLCGTRSGRDMDKTAACGFTVAARDGIPYFEQAHTVLLCKTLYRQPMGREFLIDPSVDALYPDGEYHILYVAEIERVLVRESR